MCNNDQRPACSASSLFAVGLSAGVSVIHFHKVRKQISLVPLSHSNTDTHQQIPCAFITDTELLLQQNSGNPSLIGGTKIDSPKPDSQRDMSTVHDCFCGQRNRFAAFTALIQLAGPKIAVASSATMWANKTVWKPVFIQKLSTGVLACKSFSEVLETDLLPLCHDVTPPYFTSYHIYRTVIRTFTCLCLYLGFS